MLKERIKDLAERAQRSHRVTFTPFLDPAALRLAKDLCKLSGARYAVCGGFEGAERNVLAFLPDHVDGDDFDPTTAVYAVRITPSDCSRLTHRDYLGSILSLGLKRDAVGDIAVDPKGGTAILTDAAARLVLSELTSVGNRPAHTQKTEVEGVAVSDETPHELVFTVQSVRIDTVLCGALKLSRSAAGELIKSGKVSRNWVCCIDQSGKLSPSDTLSIRGFGRVVLKSVEGKSKKGKIYVCVDVYAG